MKRIFCSLQALFILSLFFSLQVLAEPFCQNIFNIFTKQKLIHPTDAMAIKPPFNHNSTPQNSLTKKTVQTVSEKIFFNPITALSLNSSKISNKFDLKKRKYRAIYTQGLDHSAELIALGRKLRENFADPLETHVPEFADFIQKHIYIIKQSLMFQKQQNIQSQNKKTDYLENRINRININLKILAELEQKIREKIIHQQVTYAWYLRMNYYLAMLASYRSFGLKSFENLKLILTEQFHFGKTYKRDVEDFPRKIFLPTTEALGVMAFNRSYTEGIYFINLAEKNIYADGMIFDPINFFEHDVSHGNSIFYQLSTNSEIIRKTAQKWKEIFPKLMNRFEKLPPEKREMAEMVYFMIAHEIGTVNFLDNIFNAYSITHLQDKFRDRFVLYRFLDNYDLAPLLPENIRRAEGPIQAYLDNSAYLFMQILKDIDS